METRDLIIAEIAKEARIPFSMTKTIINSQTQLVVQAMNEGLYKKIRLPFLGTFSVKEGRVEKLNAKKLCQKAQ